MNKQKIELIVAILIPVFLLGLLAFPATVLTKFQIDCNKQRTAAREAAQPRINEFNKIALLGESPPQKAKVQDSGDCIDSDPYETVSKTYTDTTNGGQVVDNIRTSLGKAGYAITNENFGREGCKLIYRVQAKKAAVKIYVVAYQKNFKDPNCDSGHGVGVPESYFRAENIDTTKLTLIN